MCTPQVYPGPEGKARFQQQIRELVKLTDDEEFEVEFECKAPDSGALGQDTGAWGGLLQGVWSGLCDIGICRHPTQVGPQGAARGEGAAAWCWQQG